MKRKTYSLIIIVLLLTACRHKEVPYSGINGFIQGSTYSMVFENAKGLDPAVVREKVESILHKFDMSLSMYIDSSILSKVNRNEDVKVDSFFTEVFKKSVLVSELTDGAFDITVGPLVRAWGFGPDKHKTFTEQNKDSLLQLVGMKKVSLADGQVIKTNPHIYLDFNAIAQGYSVDVICNYFESIGIHNYLVEIGGEVRARGKKNGNLWRIGVDKPEDNNLSPGKDLEAIVRITDKALATSGNYRKFFVEDGVKYSHEIDPITGYTVKNTVLSVSVIADECAIADGLATAFMVMGKEKTEDFLSRHPEYQVYLIYSDEKGYFKTWASDKLKSYIEENH
jgi:FAD:protein FMN transferase